MFSSMDRNSNKFKGFLQRTVLWALPRIIFVLLPGSLILLILPASGGVHPPTPSSGLTLLQAIEITLAHQPSVSMAKETVRLSEGQLQEETGTFDPVISVSGGQQRTDNPLPAGSDYSHEAADTTSLNYSIKKTLRGGMVLEPAVSMNRAEDPVLYDSIQNYGGVALNLSIPLLRGRGEAATAGREMAARKVYEAALLQFRQTVSSLIHETITAYWSLVSAGIKLDELKKSESRSLEFKNNLEAMVQHDERPRGDLPPVIANYESQAALRIAGEQIFEKASARLCLAMGFSYADDRCILVPGDTLPTVPDSPPILDPTPFIQTALGRRTDYLASKETAEAARILLEAAKSGLLPILNLELSVGYNGLDEGDGVGRFANSLRNNIPGSSASAMLTYKWPVGNNAARGQVLQWSAEYQRRNIASDDLARNIRSSVNLSLVNVTKAAAEAARLRQSVLMYEQGLTNEWKKVRLGSSTFLDLIVVEDRFRTAIQSEAAAHLAYAEGIVRLRFETGTLLTGENEHIQVRMEDIMAMPN